MMKRLATVACLIVPISLLIISQAVISAQTKHPQPGRPSATVSEREVMGLANRLGTARKEISSAAEGYKASLERLLEFQQNDVKALTETLEKRKAMLAESIISKKEVDESEQSLSTAQDKVRDTKQDIASADDLIAEAQAEEAKLP